MKFTIELNNTRPDVNIGDVLTTKGGRKILLVENQVGKILAVSLEDNTVSREYHSVEDFLENYSTNYTVYKSDIVELKVKGVGLKWQ